MTDNAFTRPTAGQAERRWVWVFAACVMLLTLLPYLIAFSRQGADWRFTGFLFAAEDGNSYIAKMLSGASGSWLFRTPYTAYPQRGLLLFIPYILLGKLTAAPALHEQLTALYHLFRLAAGFMMIHAAYDFIVLFVTEVRWRRLALALATLGGGLGWLALAGLQAWFTWGWPLEWYSPEAFGFLSIYGLPHMAAARALLLWGLRDFLLAAETTPGPKKWIITAALWIGIWLFQPIALVVGIIVVVVFVAAAGVRELLRQRRGEETQWPFWKKYLNRAVLIGLTGAPLALYIFLSFKLDAGLQVWESQSQNLSPTPLTFLLAYGMVLPLALLGIRPMLRAAYWRGLLLAVWMISAPLLAYAPFSSQRRLLEGIWVVICILAVGWVAQAAARIRRLAVGWLSLAFLTTIILLAAGYIYARTPATPLFRPAGEVAVFEYLAREASAGDVVISADETANPLPAWAPVRTLTGHGAESMNMHALIERTGCFYSACSETERLALLDEFTVTYIIWGPHERALGSWNPEAAPYMQPVYSAGEYMLYRYQTPITP